MPRNNGFILPICLSVKIIRRLTAPNWDRENGTVLASETDNRGLNLRLRQKFLFSKATRTSLGFTETSVHRVPKALYPEVKGLRREAKYSPQPGVEVNNSWCYISTPPPVFKRWCLINHTDFTFRKLLLTDSRAKSPKWGIVYFLVIPIIQFIIINYYYYSSSSDPEGTPNSLGGEISGFTSLFPLLNTGFIGIREPQETGHLLLFSLCCLLCVLQAKGLTTG